MKDFNEYKNKEKFAGTVKSGVKSGDGNRELLIAEPLKRHPQLKDTYLAYDPMTNWKGWVEYVPPVPEVAPGPKPKPKPTPEEEAFNEYMQKLHDYRAINKFVQDGIIEDTDTEYVALRQYLKDNYKPEYLEIV